MPRGPLRDRDFFAHQPCDVSRRPHAPYIDLPASYNGATAAFHGGYGTPALHVEHHKKKSTRVGP